MVRTNDNHPKNEIEEKTIEYIIVPDIHGQAEKLDGLLSQLGWHSRPSGLHASTPNQELVFLGDFIDRGRENKRVIQTVRRVMDSGKAHAIMGNHELNAIHFHTLDPTTGNPLRSHTDKNKHQHANFLKEMPFGSAGAHESIEWMRSLPLYLEFSGFRAVHACWDESTIADLAAATTLGVLSKDQLADSAIKSEALFDLVETTTKGPEVALPVGHSFEDKDGHSRQNVRLKWWEGRARSWEEIAMSVPDPSALPSTPLPLELESRTYPANAKPVFFGHYWLTGEPRMQSENALCLDYSAGLDGPLMAYRLEDAATSLALKNLIYPLS